MPQKAWTDKRERQYEHIKDSYEDRGVSADEAEERAARTVNKERAEHGETKAAKKRSIMIEIGYALSSEEHTALDLVSNASAAEEAGFSFALISDHFHPWIDRQGESPFVWSVLGGIAEATDKLSVGTGVTCPMIRTHPAIIAQAAATTATLMPDRFFLGLGTGENLNEHILGTVWPNGTSAPRCSRRRSRSSGSCGAAR